MSKLTFILGLVAALLFSLAMTAHADPMIVGDIGFGSFGQYSLTGSASPLNLGNNTGFSFSNGNNAIVSVGTGDFANFDPSGPYAPTWAHFDSFTFNANNLANVITPGTELWHFTGADGKTYTLIMDTGTIVSRTQTSLTIDGTCTITATGYAPTEGTFVFEASSTGTAFTFDSNAGAVPEPATLLLLGAGLAGLVLHRSLRKKSLV